METSDEDVVEEAPPGWVLRTPTRLYEVWVLPLVALVVAALVVVVVLASSDVLTRVAGMTAAVVVTAGAVALAVAGWRAYREQARGASWDLHRTSVVTGVTIGAVVLVTSLVAGRSIGVAVGALGGLPTIMWSARSISRFDRLAVAVTCAAVAVASTILFVVGVTDVAVPEWRAATWIGPTPVVAVVTTVFAVVQFRAVTRASSE